MSGKCRPSLIRKTLANVERSELSVADKACIKTVLKKQISRKPNIHGYREGRLINTISYTCPICNKHIGREDYCKHCGQKIDWSDTE